MGTREIPGHLRELYGLDVSPDLISTVTDQVLDEIAAWQSRPLEAVHPLVFFDAIRVKLRDEGLVRNKAVHVALGVPHDGTKEILGLWLEQNEGAKFWLRVMNELKNRGVARSGSRPRRPSSVPARARLRHVSRWLAFIPCRRVPPATDLRSPPSPRGSPASRQATKNADCATDNPRPSRRHQPTVPRVIHRQR